MAYGAILKLYFLEVSNPPPIPSTTFKGLPPMVNLLRSLASCPHTNRLLPFPRLSVSNKIGLNPGTYRVREYKVGFESGRNAKS